MIGYIRRHAHAGALGLVVLGGVFVVGLLWMRAPWQALSLPDEARRLSGLDATSLATEKLREEVLQLRIGNATSQSAWSLFLSLAPLAAAITAGIGVLATLWKQMSDQAQQRQAEAYAREVANLRRFDEAFTRVVANLGAESAGLRASAAVSLPTFLRPEYSEVHDQVLLIATANLKKAISQPEPIQRLLVRVVEQALRARLKPIADSDRGTLLDFSRTFLDRADLSGLDLAHADVAFASLHNANLTAANLFGLRGIEVELGGARLREADLREARLRGAKARDAKFHNAKCVSARFENADLRGAEFYQATLQEAHFQGADLSGARFNGANLNNAFFAGATLDDPARRSIAKGALNWRKARFDDSDAAALESIGQDSGSP